MSQVEFVYSNKIETTIKFKDENTKLTFLLYSADYSEEKGEKSENTKEMTKATEIIRKSISTIYEIEKIKLEKIEHTDKAIKIPLKEPEKKTIFSCLIPMLVENATYYVEIKTSNNNQQLESYKVKLSSESFDESDYLTQLPGRNRYWKINFLNQLFYGDIEIWQNNEKVFSLPILIYPRKIAPEEAQKIIEELLGWHSELILDLEEPGLTIEPGKYWQRPPIQRLRFIRYLFDKRNLNKILNSIIASPDKKLIKEELLKEIQDVETPDCLLLPELTMESTAVKKVTANNPYHFKIDNDKYTFVKAYEEIVRITHDTYPNRFVKFFLNYLKQELNVIEEKLKTYLSKENISKGYRELISNEFLPCLNDLRNKNVNRILNREFFKEVSALRFFSTPPQILLKDYRYQQVFTAFLDLIRGLLLSDKLENLLRDPIRSMPELYEYWCFLNLRHMLEMVSGQKGEPEKFFVKEEIYDVLKYGCKIKFNDKTILTYNKYYSRFKNPYSYSVGLRPDFTLEIYDKLILFDAKYRIDWIEEVKKIGEETDEENIEREKLDKIIAEEKRGTYKIGDLYKMHTYREAIREREELKNPLWVITLYPGDKNELHLFSEAISGEDKGYIKYPKIIDLSDFLSKLQNFNKSGITHLNELKAGGVGAIPLKPKE